MQEDPAPGAGRKLRSQHVADEIKRYIVSAGLKPGDRLPTEMELAARFNVSRVSIREATKAMCYVGVLASKPRRGTVVQSLQTEHVVELASLPVSIDPQARRDAHSARRTILNDLLPSIVEATTAKESARLMEIVNRMNQLIDSQSDSEAWLDMALRFDQAVTSLGANQAMARFAHMLHALLDPPPVEPAARRAYTAGAQALTDALASRDQDAARQAISTLVD